jgi:hypothetical protein
MQNESVLIQKIYTHFKKAPGTHKLGVLYVVDSVTRQWVEAARKQGQPSGSAAPDGTFAAGVNRVTELLPVLMTDIINNAPEDQKVRLTRRNLHHSARFSPGLRVCLGQIGRGGRLLFSGLTLASLELDLRISRVITPAYCIDYASSLLASCSFMLCRIVRLTYLIFFSYRKKSGNWLISGNVATRFRPPCSRPSKKN